MRVEAAAIVAMHAQSAALHGLLLGMGCTLSPLAKGWFPNRGVLRVRLVWRNRAENTSHTTVVSLRAAELGGHL